MVAAAQGAEGAAAQALRMGSANRSGDRSPARQVDFRWQWLLPAATVAAEQQQVRTAAELAVAAVEEEAASEPARRA